MHSLFRVFILLILSASACAQWIELESGTTNNLNGISAPATHFAVAVGDNATIRRTMNYGATWDPLTGEPGIDYHAVSFPTAPFGLAAGTSGTILFTNSGGEIWETIETGWMHPYYAAHQVGPNVGAVAGINSVFQPIMGITTNGWTNYDFHVFYPFHDGSFHEGTILGIYFFNADTGLTAISTTFGEGAICRTVDGGNNWETVYWGDHSLYAMDFANSDTGCAVGEVGTIVQTTDGGLTWTSRVSGTTETLTDVSFGSPLEAWAVGTFGTILHSEDAGENWEPQEAPDNTHLNGVSFANADTGFAVGQGGTIFFTPNGGEAPNQPPGEFWRLSPGEGDGWIGQLPGILNWTESSDPDTDAVTYILRIWSTEHPDWQDSTFVLPDTQITVEIPPPPNILIEYTMFWTVQATDEQDTVMAANGVGTFIVYLEVSADDPASGLPREFTLSAYPNPFNPTTILHLSLPVSSEAVLRVFDVTGRLVQEIPLGRLASGVHAIPFDGSDLPSGIYIAAVETPIQRVVQKLVVMK